MLKFAGGPGPSTERLQEGRRLLDGPAATAGRTVLGGTLGGGDGGSGDISAGCGTGCGGALIGATMPWPIPPVLHFGRAAFWIKLFDAAERA